MRHLKIVRALPHLGFDLSLQLLPFDPRLAAAQFRPPDIALIAIEQRDAGHAADTPRRRVLPADG